MSTIIKFSRESETPTTHVIFLHGLGGDIIWTWTHTDNAQFGWPGWLVEDVEGLGAYCIGFDAAVSRWSGTAMHLTDRATNILARLLVEEDLQHGEIIFIGHSLGGLVVKQVLRTAESEARHSAPAASLLERVKKVAFLATPHSGAALASWADRFRILIRPSIATLSLVRNDPNLRDLNLWYRDWANSNGMHHLVLTETRAIRVLGMVVLPDSSDPGLAGSRPIPIDADHLEISKPTDRSSDIYRHVRAFIERRYRNSTSPARSFVGVPPRVQSFVGRATLFSQLHSLLMPATSVTEPQLAQRAAVCGMGGVGKTTFAVEYAHAFRDSYTGIWWLRAETEQALRAGLEDFAVNIAGAVRSQDPTAKMALAQTALDWLAQHRQNWLFIYDNVTSPDELANLLPSSPYDCWA
jgi:pimeloyl-ACP methyl ester carboxylesterase